MNRAICPDCGRRTLLSKHPFRFDYRDSNQIYFYCCWRVFTDDSCGFELRIDPESIRKLEFRYGITTALRLAAIANRCKAFRLNNTYNLVMNGDVAEAIRSLETDFQSTTTEYIHEQIPEIAADLIEQVSIQ